MANNVIKKVELENNNNPIYHCLPESKNNHPWLVMTHGEEFEKQVFYSISEDRYLKKMIPELRNKQVSQASYGWLMLMDNDTLDCCLLNPKTMEKIQLPQAVHKYKYYRCTLSKPPTEPDCHILLVSSTLWLLFCRVGDDKFIERPREIDGGFLITATNFQGKIYAWMGEERNFVTIGFVNGDIVIEDLVNEDGQQSQILPCSGLSLSDAKFVDDHLIESCGELLLVHMSCCSSIMNRFSRYRIFKIDLVEMKSKELYSIGDRAIFLSKFGSMSILCSSNVIGVKKNSIYFFNRLPENDGRNLHVFHIQDQGVTRLLPCPIVSATQSLKYWIMI